jgi:hypothetical protein
MSYSSDKSRQVDWYVRRATDVSLTLTMTASGAYNASLLNLSCGVYRNNVLQFSPIIVNGGVTGIVTLSLTNTQTNVSEDQYFWKLTTTTPIDLLILQGVFKVNDFLWDGEDSNASNSVVVDINGTDVTISIETT